MSYKLLFSADKSIRFTTTILRSGLCDYNDVYIVVKGIIIVTGTSNAHRRNNKLTFKNNTPFRSCIPKIDNTYTDKAEEIDIVMPMFNLLEYSDNYSIISGHL